MTHPHEYWGPADRLLDRIRGSYAQPPDDIPAPVAREVHTALLLAHARAIATPDVARPIGLHLAIRVEAARIRDDAADLQTPANDDLAAVAGRAVGELGAVIRRLETEFAHQF